MSAAERWAENPFYVLGLRPEVTRAEIEREGQKLLGMLELGLSAAATYSTPLGARERSADLVRRAMAELRDPEKRLMHEVWARLEARRVVDLGEDSQASDGGEERAAWKDALVALGWERRR